MLTLRHAAWRTLGDDDTKLGDNDTNIKLGDNSTLGNGAMLEDDATLADNATPFGDNTTTTMAWAGEDDRHCSSASASVSISASPSAFQRDL